MQGKLKTPQLVRSSPIFRLGEDTAKVPYCVYFNIDGAA